MRRWANCTEIMLAFWVGFLICTSHHERRHTSRINGHLLAVRTAEALRPLQFARVALHLEVLVAVMPLASCFFSLHNPGSGTILTCRTGTLWHRCAQRLCPWKGILSFVSILQMEHLRNDKTYPAQSKNNTSRFSSCRYSRPSPPVDTSVKQRRRGSVVVESSKRQKRWRALDCELLAQDQKLSRMSTTLVRKASAAIFSGRRWTWP